MNVFETIKAAVPMREAAKHYGSCPTAWPVAHSTMTITQA